MILNNLSKLSILQQKQLSRIIPLLTKLNGHLCTIYYPQEQESIYNRDSQELLYGANPDDTINLLFDKIPELRNEMEDLIDSFDLDDYVNIYTLNDSIPKDSQIRTRFNSTPWAFRVKDKKIFYGADDKLLYVKYSLVGFS